MSDNNDARQIALPEPKGHAAGVLVFAHGAPVHFAIESDESIARIAAAVSVQQCHMLDGGSQIATIALTDAQNGTTYHLTPFGIREVVIVGKGYLETVAPRRGRIALPDAL